MPDPNEVLFHRLDRTLFTHTVLFAVAESALARCRKEFNQDDCLTAIVMAAFSFEGYLNYAGEELLKFWHELDSIRTEEKLSVLAIHLGFKPDFGCRPYQSLKELWKVRNLLAHPRTEYLSEMRDGPPTDPISYPETTWESKCKLETVERLVADVKAAALDLHKRAKLTVGVLGQISVQGGEILRKRRPDEACQ